MKNEYNSYFFNEFQKVNGGNNYMDEEKWVPFFQEVAQKIVDLFNPTTVLDAGCACGYLVAALRDLGVQAYGIDVSGYAIGKTREDVKEYCVEHSITEPLPSGMPKIFDLVVVTEVLELLFPEDGVKAISNLCKHTNTVVFSSTSTDIEDRTHVNVQQPEYWAEMFFGNSFAKSFIFDMSFLSPWCVVYEKFADMKKLIFNYELNMRIDKMQNEKNLTKTVTDLVESLFKVTSKVSFEDVSGYSERSAVKIPQNLTDNQLSISVPIPEDTLKLCFEPVLGQACLLKNLEIYLDNQQVSTYQTNGESVNSYILFRSSDPQIIVDQVEGKKEFRMNAKFQHMDEEFIQLYEGKNTSVQGQMAQLNHQVSEAEQKLQTLTAEFDLKNTLLLEKEQVIAEKIEELADKNASISKRDTSLLEKESLIKQKDAALMDYSAKIAEKDTLLSEKNTALEEKEELLSKHEKIVEEKLAEFKSREGDLLEKVSSLETQIESLEEIEKTLGEKEALIVRRDFEISEKKKELTEQIALLSEKDGTISEMDDELYQKSNQLANLSEEATKNRDHAVALQAELAQVSSDLEKVQNTYDSMRESSVWKLVAPFYKEPKVDEEDSSDEEETEGKKAKGKKEPKGKDAKAKKEVKGKKDPKDKKEAKEKKEKGKKEKKEPKEKKEKDVKSKKEPKGKKGSKSSKKGKDLEEEGIELEDEPVGSDESILDDMELVAEVPEEVVEEAVEVQPVVVKPQPVATKPQPVATKPQPVATKPQPVATKPQPVATKPQPVVTKTQPVGATKTATAVKPVAKVEPTLKVSAETKAQ